MCNSCALRTCHEHLGTLHHAIMALSVANWEGGGGRLACSSTCNLFVPCALCMQLLRTTYAQRTHRVRTAYAPSTHRVRTAYAPRTQCVRGAYMPCDGSLVAIIVCRQLVCTAYAPRTHRVRTAYAPRTHRVRTEYAPRTQCVRVAHIRVVGYEGGWVSGPPPPPLPLCS